MFTSVTKTVPLSFLKLDPSQVKRHSQENIEFLAKDIEARDIQHDPSIMEDGSVICGNGRAMALERLGRKEVQVKIYNGITEKDFAIIRLTNNIHCEKFTTVQQYDQIVEIQRLHPEMKNGELAELMAIRPSWMTQLLSVQNCIPPVQEGFRAGLVAITKVYEISKETPEKQHELWQLMQTGVVSRDTLRGKARASKNGARKVSKARIALSEGEVVIRRKALDMRKVIASLEECLLHAKDDVEKLGENLEVKTFELVMADRAKKT